MAINGVMAVGGGLDAAQKECVKQTQNAQADNSIFAFQFEPESFGGKAYEVPQDTSIFDAWDS